LHYLFLLSLIAGAGLAEQPYWLALLDSRYSQ